VGVVKSHHAIAFTSRNEPDKRDDEKPRRGEDTMLPGIRIKPRVSGDKLDQMARIDFARIYTVEHNVKVYDFGDVARDYMERLIQQWIKILLNDDQGALNAFGAAAQSSYAGDSGDSGDADEGDYGEEPGYGSYADHEPRRNDDDRKESSKSEGPKKSTGSGRTQPSSGSSRHTQPPESEQSRSSGKKSSYPPEPEQSRSSGKKGPPGTGRPY
jgi:hypothetical protein